MPPAKVMVIGAGVAGRPPLAQQTVSRDCASTPARK
ncbi:hypothetical protein ACNKHX_09895 [Shigella flexneri]